MTAARFFAGMCLIKYFLSAEYSVFPAAFLDIQKDLAMSDFEMGIGGSLVFTGLMAGACLAPPALVHYPKQVLSFAMLLCAFATFATAYAPSKYLMYVARFFVGVFHAPAYVYMPVWVESYAPSGMETRWQGWLEVVGPLANVTGYAITAGLRISVGVSWRDMYALIAGTYLVAFFASYFVHTRWYKTTDSTAGASVTEAIKGWVRVLPYPSFWFLVAVPVLGYYCVCAVEYFAARMFVELGAPKDKVPEYFLIVAVAGPVLFVLLSGPFFDYIGGYRKRKTCLKAILAIHLCAMCFVPWAWRFYKSSFASTCIATTIMMGLYAATIPPVIGLILLTVEAELRPFANGLFGFLASAVGFQLGPVVSGAVMAKLGVEAGWKACFAPTVLGPIMIFCVLVYENGRNWLDREDEETLPLLEQKVRDDGQATAGARDL
jgi:MFS family permease